jgi:hypothetical protein
VAMPVLPAGTDAWVRPVFSPLDGSTGSTLDQSGLTLTLNGGAGSCRGWSSASKDHAGLRVDANGAFKGGEGCDAILPVACCARIIVVPEPSASLQLGTGILSLAALSGRAVCGS